MSLLMDALKRAEKARRAEAEGASEPSEAAPAQGLSLDPMDDPPPRPPAARPPRPAEPPREDTRESSFELAPDELDDTALSFRPGPMDTGEQERDVPEDSLADARLSLDDDPLDDTSATLPSIKAAQASVDDYFDGTRSLSMSMDTVRGALGETDTITGERVAVDTGQQEAARTVFDAKRRRTRSHAWVAVALVPLLLLALLAGGGWYFRDPLMRTFVGEPSLATRPPAPVAAASAPPPPAPRPEAVAASTPGASPAPGVAPAPPPIESASVAPPPVPAPAPGAGTGSSLAGPVPGTPAGAPSSGAGAGAGTSTTAGAPVLSSGEFLAVAPSVAEVSTPAPLPEPPPLPGEGPIEERLAAAIERAGLQTPGAVGSAGIKISRRSVPARVHPQLQSAYTAYMAGDMDAARRGYRRVLSGQPRNRDALLGLAAVATVEGQTGEAAGIYQHLLQLDPRDSMAQTALLSLQTGLDPVAAESRVKSLLRAEPQAAHLHFTLGNLLATQQRWAEAQQAYFDAYRLDPENADHAYNLAVALDRLQQRQAAHQYYQRALALSGASPYAFSTDAAQRRVVALEAAR